MREAFHMGLDHALTVLGYTAGLLAALLPLICAAIGARWVWWWVSHRLTVHRVQTQARRTGRFTT